ncbi:hypothetical protein ACUTJJ_00305 [Agrobacterium sp. DKPNP3]|uniref:hypothetical protein n=1 Tax=Agrobacterium sp. DKPNP3 TaxID=3457323 RepID=UPI00404488D9
MYWHLADPATPQNCTAEALRKSGGASRNTLSIAAIYSFISKNKNTQNTFCIYLPRETHHGVYFELSVFFKRLEIAPL